MITYTASDLTCACCGNLSSITLEGKRLVTLSCEGVTKGECIGPMRAPQEIIDAVIDRIRNEVNS